MKTETCSLLYFFDPLCGWCYAFHPVLDKLAANYPNWDVVYISGGMVRGASEGPVGVMSAYILGELPRVEQMSGVHFGDGFKQMMKEGTRHSSSVPPSRALAVIKNKFPDFTSCFVKELFQVHFNQGKDLNVLETYTEICAKIGVSESLFSELYEGDEALKWASEDFQFTSNCGINGYPALVLKKEDDYYMIARGFSSLDQIEGTLQAIFSA